MDDNGTALVRIFSSETCPDCKQADNDVAELGIACEALDIAEGENAA